MRFLLSKRSGFTLVEVLVVVLIITGLAAVVIGNLTEGRAKARDAERMHDLAQLQVALRIYRDGNSGYPDNATFDAGVVIGEGGALDATLVPFLTGTIKDPMGSASETTYEYVYDSDFMCGATSRKVLYAKTMEKAISSNWATVCGGTLPGANTYGLILQ
ncbi:MAG: prepilin-type N-terminal cleavage/methylation domain-containing protein [Minisyncoccia bacterium]